VKLDNIEIIISS